MNAGLLGRLLDRRGLTAREVRATFEALVDPGAEELDRAALLIALTSRGHRPAELVAFAREMRRRAVPFPVPPGDAPVDLCGSGGAEHPSFNVSTVSAFVVRAAGVRVVKHGNRSRRVCGSSDLLDALGLPVLTSEPFARASYRKLGIAFLHAPLFHPAMRALANVRRQLGVPTIFNRLGPLSNPARVRCQVTGVADLDTARTSPAVLRALGVARGIAMTSDDGCDEFSPRERTTAYVWSSPRTRVVRIRPSDHLPAEDRRGPWGPLPPADAADETDRILAGGGGARRGSVLLTSGAALWISGSSSDLAAGVSKARDALDGGAAEKLLEQLRALAAQYPRSRET
ncbi:MAG: anthranilate phosphoribosyltransferase [Thermoplasmata archaeon]